MFPCVLLKLIEVSSATADTIDVMVERTCGLLHSDNYMANKLLFLRGRRSRII